MFLIAVMNSCKDEEVVPLVDQAKIEAMKADSIAAVRQAEFEANHPEGYNDVPADFFESFFREDIERPVGDYAMVSLPEGSSIRYPDGQGKLVKTLNLVSYNGKLFDRDGNPIEATGESALWNFRIIDFDKKQPYDAVKRMLEHSCLTVKFQFPSGVFSDAMKNRYEFSLFKKENFEYAYVSKTQGKALVYKGDTIPVRFNGVLSYPRYPGSQFE